MKKEISVSEDLYEKLKIKCKTEQCDSVDAYVERILEDFVADVVPELSENDEQKIKDRLAALGYIDD